MREKKETDSGRERGAPPGRGRIFLPAAVFPVLSLLLYANSLGNGFVHDDKPLVAENRLIRDPANLGRIFASGYWTTRDVSVPELYRPLVVATFALNYFAGGSRPFGYHLANLLLHAWVSFLVFRLGEELGNSRAMAWGGGLLFAAHPVHTEAVNPAVGRSEILAAGLFLSAILLHRLARRRKRGGSGPPVAAAACYLGALLSKEHAVVLPLVLVLTDLTFPNGEGKTGSSPRRWIRDYLPYLLVALVYLLIRASVLGAVAASAVKPLDNPLVTADSLTAFLTALITIGKSVSLLVWPLRLSADYSFDQIPLASGWTDPRLLVCLAALVSGSALAIWGWRRSRMTTWSILFWSAALLPVSNLLFLIGTIFGERLLYLPSVGFCLLLGAAFSGLRRRSSLVAPALLGIVLVAGSLRTVLRNRIWHDDATFALSTAADAPRSAKAQFNLGVLLEERGQIRAAEAAYGRAAEIWPEWADVHFNRGGVLARLGRPEEAISEFHRAIQLNPNHPAYPLSLGYVLYQTGKYEEAIALYRELLGAWGETAPVLNNLGANLLALKRYPEAVQAYLRAVELDAGNVPYRINLARALEAAGDSEGAAAAYRTALRMAPDTAAALRDLGLLLARHGEHHEASELLRRAQALTPGGLDPEALEVLKALR